MNDSQTPQTGDESTWIQIAETNGSFEAEIIAGLLRTSGIPVYIESIIGLPSIFGHFGDPKRVYVHARDYDAAVEVLDEHEDDLPPSLDEPGIQL